MLDGIEEFDPLFFNISPSEAELSKNIRCCGSISSASDGDILKNSGSNSSMPSSIPNGKNCGVYLGIMNNEYGMMLNKHQTGGSATGNSFSLSCNPHLQRL
jgi:polyketide synthase PksL